MGQGNIPTKFHILCIYSDNNCVKVSVITYNNERCGLPMALIFRYHEKNGSRQKIPTKWVIFSPISR